MIPGMTITVMCAGNILKGILLRIIKPWEVLTEQEIKQYYGYFDANFDAVLVMRPYTRLIIAKFDFGYYVVPMRSLPGLDQFLRDNIQINLSAQSVIIEE